MVFYSKLPLTLTLSPPAGRGDVPRGRVSSEGGAAYPFAPLAGRRCRQADERHASRRPILKSSGGAIHVSHP
ncbi:hypothetical protein CO660_07010 [Rhizobium sp. L9]|nr:hypothetical protein CO660_07010 [Rhizobium sp. L9]